MANMKIKRSVFFELDEQDQKEFRATIDTLCKKDSKWYYDFKKIVDQAENEGALKDVKFFHSNIYGK